IPGPASIRSTARPCPRAKTSVAHIFPPPVTQAMSQPPPTSRARLPMTAQRDPERLRREEAELQNLESQPLTTRLRGYARMTGPAWLQSAMTLGAGSAVASVVAGASFGYTLLWVQPVAMLLGIIMMGALANIVLSTG